MKRFVWLCIIAFSVATLFHGRLHAAELFGVDATYSGGTISQSSSSLPELIEDVINNEESFTALSGNDFTANVTYFGLPNAIQIDVVGDTQLTITSPLTGLNKTFTGTDRNDLEDQLEDWLLESGSDEVAKLIQAAAERSAAAFLDGNPGAATARMSDRAFQTFAFYHASPAMRGTSGGKWNGLRLDYAQSRADTPSGKVGTSQGEINLPWWGHFNKHVSLIGNFVGQYQDTEGTALYGVGGDLGLGIRIVPRAIDKVFGWQVTPFAGIYGVGSKDGATGGLLNHFGVSNRFEFALGHDITLAFASQYAYYDSFKIKVENVKIDPGLRQEVVKNGLMLDGRILGTESMFLNGFIIDTRFLKNVAVDSYQTAGGGISFRGDKSSVNLSFSYDFADLFEGWRASLGFGWGH